MWVVLCIFSYRKHWQALSFGSCIEDLTEVSLLLSLPENMHVSLHTETNLTDCWDGNIVNVLLLVFWGFLEKVGREGRQEEKDGRITPWHAALTVCRIKCFWLQLGFVKGGTKEKTGGGWSGLPVSREGLNLCRSGEGKAEKHFWGEKLQADAQLSVVLLEVLGKDPEQESWSTDSEDETSAVTDIRNTYLLYIDSIIKCLSPIIS